MTEVALGTKVFSRVDKLGNLLDSVHNSDIETVYIADDGEMTGRKEYLYNRDFSFELVVFDLEYDAGLGHGRRQIVRESSEEYILIVDPDHELPANVGILLDQLETVDELGGVAGMIVEPDENRIYIEGQDFQERDNVLVRGPHLNTKSMELRSGSPLIRFDFIPNAAVFKRKSLEDYMWDSEYVVEYEHVDFYIGHWKHTDWEFGVCPEVVFRHYPFGDEQYMSHRMDPGKESASKRYFMDKWGYGREQVEGWNWCEGDGNRSESVQLDQNRSILSRAKRVYCEEGTIPLAKKAGRFATRKLQMDE